MPAAVTSRGITRSLAQHLVEAPQGVEIFGELADRFERGAEVSAVERRKMAPCDADRVDEILVAPASTLNRIRSSGVGSGTRRPNSRCLRARARASSSKGRDARMMSSWNGPLPNRSVPVACSFARSSGAAWKPAATAASMRGRPVHRHVADDVDIAGRARLTDRRHGEPADDQIRDRCLRQEIDGLATERVEGLRGAFHRLAGSAVRVTRAGSMPSARTRLSGRGSSRRSTCSIKLEVKSASAIAIDDAMSSSRSARRSSATRSRSYAARSRITSPP